VNCPLRYDRIVFQLAIMVTGLLLAQAVNTRAEAPPLAASPREIFDRAIELFFDGRPRDSAKAFDDFIALEPGLTPALWQRGLALYYAERFEDGRRQFELHKTVNPDDVENPAWHYLCVARASTPDAARASMLAVGPDARVPMREILALYRGEGTEEAVLAVASRGEGKTLRNQLCYAHLYVGLHAEVHGDHQKARRHMLQAAHTYGMDHFMGRVARMHATLRGWSEPSLREDKDRTP
jgi:lipoprotein NlpI